MTEMIDRARLAVIEVIQNSSLPVGYSIDSEKIVRAVLEAMLEPTQEMLDCRDAFVMKDDALTVWRLQINTALGKGSEE
jgi:hypothetical protein